MDCLFCKIAAGEIPSNKVYEDDTVLAFYDIIGSAGSNGIVVSNSIVPAFLQGTIVCLFNHFKIGSMDLGGVLLVYII